VKNISLHLCVYILFFRAFVYLTNLLYGLSLVQNVAIVSERGDIKGYIKIAIQQLQTSTQETTNEQIKLTKTYRNASGLTKIAFDDETYFQVRKNERCFFRLLKNFEVFRKRLVMRGRYAVSRLID